MAAPIYCDAGCGQLYVIELGVSENPVHQFLCPEHFMAASLELMNMWLAAAHAGEETEPGTEAEAKAVIGGRKRPRRPRPRRVAVDDTDGAVVADPPAEDEKAAGEG